MPEITFVKLADLPGQFLHGYEGRIAQEYFAPDTQIPAIANLEGEIVKAISAGGSLDMDEWHTCETVHCIAGWTVYLAGPHGRALEKRSCTSAVAYAIFAASGSWPPPSFFPHDYEAFIDGADVNEAALAELQRRAALHTIRGESEASR